jgi:hypothetical protein
VAVALVRRKFRRVKPRAVPSDILRLQSDLEWC